MLLFSTEYAFSISGCLTALCAFLALLYIISNIRKRRTTKLPPGPYGLPVVGYLPFLSKMPHLKLGRLAAKYGNIFSLYMGSNFVVVLNSAKIIREAFSKPEFLGRPPENQFLLAENFESPFFSNGKAWKEQRRFALHTMRDLGFGKSLMEKHILDEIDHILEVIKKSGGMPIDIKETLTPSMSNNICSLVFGSRYKYDDPDRMYLNNILDSVTQSFNQLSVFFSFPWLKKLPFSKMIFKCDALAEAIEKLRQFMKEQIDRHDKTLDPSNMRDYIDGYLIEMKQRLEKDPETTFSHNMLIGSVLNLFGAGSESVRTTIDWCLYAMAAFHDVQKKVQAEIDDVIGRERKASYVDQREMPFTQAVLMEMHRWQSIVPINILRYTLEDTQLEGYHIPKGTTILANFWSVHHDPAEWKDPLVFKPDRFLDKDGKIIEKSEGYMPFSVGKRSCPGKILALIEVFLYFTSILQIFDVKIPEKSPVCFEGEIALTYRLKPHKLCFKHRF